MPAYNAAPYIAESIRSVIEQTHKNWELIVLDDGSTDGTAGVAGDIAKDDDRVKVIPGSNLGQGRARNVALGYARGEWVAFLDADDLWLPDKLIRQLQAARRTNADVVFSDGWIFVENDSSDESQSFGTITGEFNGAEMFRLLFEKNRIPMPSVLVRRRTLEEVGFFDGDERWNRNCEDYELWLRLAEHGAVFYGMEEKLVRYRHRRDSASSRSRKPGDEAQIRWHNSRSLEAMIAVCGKYRHNSLVTPAEAERRLRDLHRELLATLLEENKTSEARLSLRHSLQREGLGLRLIAQYALTYLAPGRYNTVRAYFQHLRWSNRGDHAR